MENERKITDVADKISRKRLGIVLALILRHKPQEFGVNLDEHGWANTKKLIKAMNANRKYMINMEVLEKIVKEDEKQRFSFNDDKTKIRANQGHSVHVNVEMKEMQPPDVLYHGTSTRFLNGIFEKGILHESRLYVHLSLSYEIAMDVGVRHGNPIVLEIDTKGMYEDGYKFYLSANGIWMTDYVPKKYFKIAQKKGA